MAASGWQLIEEDGADYASFEQKTSTIKYCVIETDDLAEANGWVVANSPGTYFGMPRVSINHQFVGNGIWLFDVEYGGKRVEPDNPSGPTQNNTALDFQFETILETFRIDTAINDTVIPRPPLAVADFNKVIGLSSNPDQPPQGVDIGAGLSRWTETYKWPVAQITGAYELLVDNLTGKINNAPFRGRNTACVLFLGCRSRASSTDYIEVSYNFEYRAPKSNYDVGGITVTFKAGYQLQEVVYGIEKDDTNKVVKRIPQYVRIMDVLEEDNFAQLGIGTGPRP